MDEFLEGFQGLLTIILPFFNFIIKLFWRLEFIEVFIVDKISPNSRTSSEFSSTPVVPIKFFICLILGLMNFFSLRLEIINLTNESG